MIGGTITAEDPRGRATGRSAALRSALIVAAATAAAYLPSLRNGFTNWDDEAYVVYNSLIRDLSAAKVWSMLTTLQVMGNYHPLTLLSYALEYAAAGAAPFVFHVTNLALHLATTLLVYRLVRLIDEREPVAFTAALLFGIHPLHVESVAWISARKDVLFACCYVGAMIAYLRYREQNARGWYAAALLLGLLAIAAKGVAVTLPAALLALDLLAGRRIGREALREKLPFAAAGLAGGIVAIAAQQASSSLAEPGAFSLLERVQLICHSLLLYCGKFVVPVRLSAVYPYPPPGLGWQYAAATAAAAAGAWLLYRNRRDRRLLFAAVFFVCTIAPVLQVVPVGRAVMADRYSYLPSIALCYLAAGWMVALVTRTPLTPVRRAARALPVLYCLLLVAATWQRCGIWQSSERLWTDVLEQFPASEDALSGRGSARFQAGALDGALADFDRLVAVDPDHVEGHVGRGNVFVRRRDYGRALAAFDRAVGAGPRYPLAYYNRGIVQAELGRLDAAAGDFSEAVRLHPAYPEAYVNRGIVRLRQERPDAACADFRSALALGSPDARELLARYCR